MKKAFAFARARDVLEAMLPQDSAIAAVFTKLCASRADEYPHWSSSDDESLELYKLALKDLELPVKSSQAPAVSSASPLIQSANSILEEINRILPELVMKHWAFRGLLALFVALLGFGVFGVFKIYNYKIDMQSLVDQKRAELTAQLEKEKSATDTLDRELKASVAAYGAQSAEIASKRVAQPSHRSSHTVGVDPPSIRSTVPVINAASGLARKQTYRAISSTRPRRLTVWRQIFLSTKSLA